MNRFFVDSVYIGDDHIVINSPEDIRHITKVLRLSKGDSIDVSDGERWEYRAEIMLLDQTHIEARIADKQAFAREPHLHVTLFQGIPKQSKMETIIQKCVEMGVHEVVPVFTRRTVVTDNGKMQNKVKRWQKVAAEAVKQCQRGLIPQVTQPIELNGVIEKADQYDLVLFPYENEEKRTIKDCLENLKNPIKNAAMIIGPEGGFSDEEAKMLIAAGGECVSLGKTILRTETAGMAALAMIMYELEL